MSDELESILTESLRHRAQQAGVRTHGFGDVRRRVRRHRQRQMAAGLLPAVAGFGWIVTRPVADDPLRPGEGAAGCDSTLPAPTSPGLGGDPTSTTMMFDSNGNVVPPSALPDGSPWPTMSDGSPWPPDANGLPATTIAGLSVTQTTWYIDANGNPTATMVVPATDAVSSTIACEDPTSLPPITETTAPNLMRVIVVNASSVNGVAMATVNSFFPGAAVANATVQREESYIVLMNPDAGYVAKYVAAGIGVDVKSLDRAAAVDEIGLVGVDLADYDVVLVLGNTFANSFAGSPSTTSSVPGTGDAFGGYQPYTVVEGDSLVSIASFFGITIGALADANGWPGGGASRHLLFPGDVIRIPPATASSIG